MSSYQSFMNYSVLLFVSGIDPTYIDIVFTLIASSDFSNETYALMETTAKQFIEEYQYVNHYVIAYVDGELKLVNFSFDANDSNAVAGRARRAVGASEPLINVLEEAYVAFQNNFLGESNNRKALVVMTDISSSTDKKTLEKSETRARVKITPREKWRHFARGVIFTRARVSLALLSLRKNGGLLVV